MTDVLPRHIAVIDIGKTNAKLVLIDSANWQTLDTRSMANVVLRDGPYPHADVDALWQFIRDGLRELGKNHGIDGISITTHGASGVLLADGELALPIIDYEFDGPEQTVEAYGAVRPDFSETLSPRLPNGLNVGAQIFWQAKSFPKDFARVTAILTYAQYWAWRLTGTLASEVTSLGCHTDLWNPRKGGFSSLVDKMDWRHLFPPLHPAASVLGTLTPDIAAATGLPVTTPVTCGIHDSNASLLPHLGRGDAPLTVVSTGTWAIVMTIGGGTDGLDPLRDSLANVDAYGRPVPTARFMGGREFDILVPKMVEPGIDDIRSVIEGNIQALPGFVPGVGPFPSRTGGWTHDPESLPPGQRNAAASLYLALVARASIDLCGLGESIILEGPLARNQLFGAALAALTGVPVHASADSTGTSLGAALLFGGRPAPAHGTRSVAPLQHDGFDAYVARWRTRL